MSEQYTAWDGIDYPWPPPEGWVIGSDGRYWPDGQQPVEAEASAPSGTTQLGEAGVPPPSAETPPPSAFAAPPPPATPAKMPPPNAYTPIPPSAQQVPGTYTYGAPPAKSSKAGWWILGILLTILALGLGGCLLVVAVLADGAEELGNSLEEFEDDFTRRNEASQAISVSSCSVVGGVPTASGTVTNPRSSDSSYFVQIEFIETGTGTLLGKADVSIFDVGPGDSEQWELPAPVTGIEGAIQCERGPNSIRIAD